MKPLAKLTETESLEFFRVSLENVNVQKEIAQVMAELGYDSTKVDEGKQLWMGTRQAFDTKNVEGDEKSAAFGVFSSKKDALSKLYKLHRKKGKVVFNKDPLILKKLMLTGTMPITYVAMMESYRKFYTELNNDTALQNKMAVLKVPIEEIKKGKELIEEIENARIVYLKEIGESQDATQIKDKAFAKLEKWMSEFYAVAEIALEDSPQLLEALGKVVK